MVKKINTPENKDLVDALESIRGLLEKSETKLSAARENLQKAKQPATSNSKSKQTAVPMLDDIVLESSPRIDDNLIPLPDASQQNILPQTPTSIAAAEGKSADEVLACIDLFETSLEKLLHQSLIQAIVRVESEIKQSLRDQIQLLREEIQHKRKK